jgi:hypothetical protein
MRSIDGERLAADLSERAFSLMPGVVTRDECRELSALYDEPGVFRSRVEMARHRFGQGEYKYFDYPLPALVEELRTTVYPLLAPIASEWRGALGEEVRFPPTLAKYLAMCHAAGQKRPTPLLLKYEAGGYNALHQDLYGELSFPLQMAVFLSEPGHDYTGGEFLLVEQRPRAQSVGRALLPRQGDAVVFAVDARPARGARGFHKVRVRHGVSEVLTGRRATLGVIFHDAR